MPKITSYEHLTAPAPADELVIVDVSDPTMSPAGTTKNVTAGVLAASMLDANASDIQPLAATAAAGSAGLPADAGHVHPDTGVLTSGTAAGGVLTGTYPDPGITTLNQDTTGKSAKTDALNSATTAVNVAAAAAPASGQVLTATSGTAATWQAPAAAGGMPVINLVTDSGADPTGSVAADTAFASWKSAILSSGKPGYIPPGTFKITSVLNWMTPGLTVIGAGSGNSKIQQATANTPIVQVAGQGQHISGLTLSYVSQQASGNAAAIALGFGDDTVGSSFESVFDDLRLELAQTGTAINPAVASKAGLFSCTISNIEVIGYSASAIHLKGSNGGGANATGCVFSNIYVHNNITGTDNNSTSWPVYFEDWDELVIDQLNIEHAETFNTEALALVSVGTATINGLHLEHLEVSGNPGWGFIYLSHATTAVINGMTIRFSTQTGTSYNSVARFNGDSGCLILNGFREPADGGINASHPWADFNSATNARVFVNGVSVSQVTSNAVNAAAGDIIQVGAGLALTATGVRTANYTAAAGDLVPCDTTSGAFTVTLPNAPADKACVAVKLVIKGAGNNVTVSAAGSDVFNKAGGATSMTLQLAGQAILFHYKASGGIWYILSDDLPLGQLDARYGAAIGTIATAGASPAITADTAGVWNITLSANVTGMTITGATSAVAQSLTLYISQPASGTTNYTVAWPGSVTWLSGSAPVVATGASALTVITLETTDGGTTWRGSPVSPFALPLPVTDGGTGVSALSAYQVVAGGTSANGPVQQVSGTGTPGQVLTSNGASALPTWQAGLDTTASDIAALGTQAAGSVGKSADAGHVHPTTGVVLTANNLSDVTAATARTNLGLAYDTTAANIKVAGTQATGSSGLVPNSDHVHPAAYSNLGVSPAGLGLVMLTIHPAQMNLITSQPAAGGMILALVTATQTTTVNQLGIWVLTAGAGATTAGNVTGMAIYSEAGAALANTGDMATALQSTGFAEGTISGGVSVTAGTSYYIAYVQNMASTAPKIACLNSGSGTALPALNTHILAAFTANGAITTAFTSQTISGLTKNSALHCMYAR